jgi:hypothetical protein
MDQIVPAAMLLLANLMSGRHGSRRYEVITAVFGWAALGSMLVWLGVLWISPHSRAHFYLAQVWGFSLLTAVSRDYEKILRPLFRWNRE